MHQRDDAPMLSLSASCEESGTDGSATPSQPGQKPGLGIGCTLGCTGPFARSTQGQQESEAYQHTLGDRGNMVPSSAMAGYSSHSNAQPGRVARSDKLNNHEQSVQSGIPSAAADINMSTGTGSDMRSSSRLLLLYQEKEVLSEEAHKIRTRKRKDLADIAKLQLLAAQYMNAAEQRAKLLFDLEEQERSSNQRISQIKDEITRLET
ncbi:hypothetical protein LTR56_025020 [Elasticomyces elasticus]|nr:hypothetical protein LTR56_025020 [Elasticomyces elasticus]KAK3621350.1 hypothetical protein LTR22_025230 [Elasticomyces elasticus]KAK4904042.1 hypothetical protein LTR49_026437 [Elasticomyces elasticus]KAK5741548.1 hypothetical protein LTS12_024572 [Elasticomyces elasticus]